MSETTRHEQIAAEIAAALRELPLESQQAYRYLFARVALDCGLVDLVGQEIRESGTRLVFRDRANGALLAADRPRDWSVDEEEAFVADLRGRLLGGPDPDA